MLEISNNIHTLYESDISVEKIYNIFFQADSSIIYILDSEERFSGIITSGDFMRHLRNGDNAFINRNCSAITLKSEKLIFNEAEELFENYHITTAIPIIDEKKRICFEIRKRREDEDEKFLSDFYNKLEKYEKSRYLGEEVVKLKKLLQDQSVVIIGEKEQFRYKCGKLFDEKKEVVYISELKDAYEYMYDNKSLLIDVSLSPYSGRRDLYSIGNNGYEWRTFLDRIISMIRMECFSRFYRVTNNTIVTLKDYLEKYSDGKISFSSWGILTSAIKGYLEKNHFSTMYCGGVCREDSFQYRYKGNGIQIDELLKGELLVIEQADAMLQYFLLNKELNGRVPVLNFAFDVRIQMPDKKERVVVKDRWFNLKNYIVDVGKDTDISLYVGDKESKLQHITELESSLNLCITRRFENDLLVWKDYASTLVNVENGMRRTCHQPEYYVGTIYFIGMCTMYGAYVEDYYTIPSIIQKYMNEAGKKYRAVNLGNAVLTNSCHLVEALNISENDIVVILFPYITEGIKNKISVIEIGEDFNLIWKDVYKNKEVFRDIVQHCGDYGSMIYSKVIYQYLDKYLPETKKGTLKKNSIYNILKKNKSDLNILYLLNDYMRKLQEEKKKIPMDVQKVGSIVMNCNPFTMGHRYLIEYALKCVDYLFVFIVEENKSFFKFEDRIEMVRRGTSDLENISIIESGQLIASEVTFPTYFKKDDRVREEDICVNEDLRVFAQYIAPVLNIKYRFVGEEPMDYVTRRYNMAMKKILSEIYGIQVVEIPRICRKGNLISAKLVRKYYMQRDYRGMNELVPDTTIGYLKKISGKYVLN